MRFRLLRLTPLRREAVDQAPALGSTMIYPGNRPGVGASLMAAAVRVVTSHIEPLDLAFGLANPTLNPTAVSRSVCDGPRSPSRATRRRLILQRVHGGRHVEMT
jgi:hypothetical protein